MKIIKLSKGKETIVDDDMYDELNKYNWIYSDYENSKYGYALRNISIDGNRKGIMMHRVVNNTPDGYYTDHLNRDRLDNRRENLRTCTISQNSQNSSLNRKNTSGYRGVSWSKISNKWLAYINYAKKRVHIGFFDNKNDAATAYNNKAIELFGEFAAINKIID